MSHRLRAPLLILGLALTDAAAAHTQAGVAGGLASGFLHPITGLDHLIAMVAVGLWGAQLGAPAVWVLPIAFPLVMAFAERHRFSPEELARFRKMIDELDAKRGKRGAR